MPQRLMAEGGDLRQILSNTQEGLQPDGIIQYYPTGGTSTVIRTRAASNGTVPRRPTVSAFTTPTPAARLLARFGINAGDVKRSPNRTPELQAPRRATTFAVGGDTARLQSGSKFSGEVPITPLFAELLHGGGRPSRLRPAATTPTAPAWRPGGGGARASNTTAAAAMGPFSQPPPRIGSSYVSRASAAAAARARATSRRTSGLVSPSPGAMPRLETLGSRGHAPSSQSQIQAQGAAFLQMPKRSGVGFGPHGNGGVGGRSGASTPQLRVPASQSAASRRNPAAAVVGTGRGVALRALTYTEWLEAQTPSLGSMQPQWRSPSDRTTVAAAAATHRGVGLQLPGRKPPKVAGGGGAGAGAAPRTPPPITPVTAKMARGPADTSSVYSTPTAHSPAATSGLPTPPRRLRLPSNSPSRELSFLEPGDSGSGRGSGDSDGNGGAFGIGGAPAAARILADMGSMESSSINLAAIPSLTTLTGVERLRPGLRMGPGDNGGGRDGVSAVREDRMLLPGVSAVMAAIGNMALQDSGTGDKHLYGGAAAAGTAEATLTAYALPPSGRALGTADAAMSQRRSIHDNAGFAASGMERQKAPKLPPPRSDALRKTGPLYDGYNGTRSHDYLRHHQQNVYGGVDSGDTFDGGTGAGGRPFRPSERGEYGLSASDMDESDFDRASILLDDIVRQDSVVGGGQLSPAVTLRRMSSMEGGGGGARGGAQPNYGGAAAAAVGSGSSGLPHTGRSPQPSTSSRQVRTSSQPRQWALSGSLLDRTIAAAVAATTSGGVDGFPLGSEPGLVISSSPQTSRPPSQASGMVFVGSGTTARTASLDPWELPMLGDMAGGAIGGGVNASHGTKQVMSQGTPGRQSAPRVAKVRSFRLRMSTDWVSDEEHETDCEQSGSAQPPAQVNRPPAPGGEPAAGSWRGTSDDGSGGGGGGDGGGGGGGGGGGVAAVYPGVASSYGASQPEQGPAFSGGGDASPRGQLALEGPAAHREAAPKPSVSHPGGSFWSASSYGGGVAAGRRTSPANAGGLQQQQQQQVPSQKQLPHQLIHHSHIRQESFKQLRVAVPAAQPAQPPSSGLPSQASIHSRLSPTTSVAQTPSGSGTTHQSRNGSPVTAPRAPAPFLGLTSSPVTRVGMSNETPAEAIMNTLTRELRDSTTPGASTGTPGAGFSVGMGGTVWSPGSRATSGGQFIPRASHGTLNSPVSVASEMYGAVRGSISGASNFSALSGPQAGVIYNYPSHGYVERAAEYGRWEAAMMYDLDLYSSMQLQGNPSPDEYDDPSYLAGSQTILSSTARPYSTGMRPIAGSGAGALMSNHLGMQHLSPREPEVRHHIPPRRTVSASASMLAAAAAGAAAASGAAFPGPGPTTRGSVPPRWLMRSSRSWSPLRFSSTAATGLREAGVIAPGSPRGRVTGESMLEVLDQILEEESSSRLSSVMIERTSETMSPVGPNSANANGAAGVPSSLLSTDSFAGSGSPREPSLGAWPSFRRQPSHRRSGSSDGRLNFNVGRVATQQSGRPSIDETVTLPPPQQKVEGSEHSLSSTAHARGGGPQRADSMSLGDALLKTLDGPLRCVSPPLLVEDSSIGAADNTGGGQSSFIKTWDVNAEPRLALSAVATSARPQTALSSSSTASSPREPWPVGIDISTYTSNFGLPEAARSAGGAGGAAAAAVATAVHSRSPRGNGGRPQLASYFFPPTIPEEILSHPLSSLTLLSASSSATGSAISSMVQIPALSGARQQQHQKEQQKEQEKGQVQQMRQQQQQLQALQVQKEQQMRSQVIEVLPGFQRSGSGLGSDSGRGAALLRARSGPLEGPQHLNEAVRPLLNRMSDGGSHTAAAAVTAAAAPPNPPPRPRTAPNVGETTNPVLPSTAAVAGGPQLLAPSSARGNSGANVSECLPQGTGVPVDGMDTIGGPSRSDSFHRRFMQPLLLPDWQMRADKAVGDAIWGSSSTGQELLCFQSQVHSQQACNIRPLQHTRSGVHTVAPSFPSLEPQAPQLQTGSPLGAAATINAGRYPPPNLESIQRLLELDLPSPAIAAAVGVLAGSLPQTWLRQQDPCSHKFMQPGKATVPGREAGAASGNAAGSTSTRPGFRGVAGGTGLMTAAASLQRKSVVGSDHPDILMAEAESPYNVDGRLGPISRSYMALLTLAGERGMPPKQLQEDGDKLPAQVGQLKAAYESHPNPMEDSSTVREHAELPKGGIAQLGDGSLGRAVRLIAQSILIVLAGAAGATAAASSANAIFMRPEDLPYEHGTSIYYTKYPRQKRLARTLYNH
ncbi:hypothetical protein VaNZ11_012696 [Volvox africanus]|uniref:Guanylate cyclase domain-containing protein n=1 Tax=Volvox africanus TaxID=51714 RepID=A0ABQ5SEP5_9CHLO|nr:hypothetical protein VaNZ11_012696 [Volvox africanus]